MLTGPLPRLVDHYKLANHEQDLEGSVPLNKFTRLCEMLNGSDGDVIGNTHVTGGADSAPLLLSRQSSVHSIADSLEEARDNFYTKSNPTSPNFTSKPAPKSPGLSPTSASKRKDRLERQSMLDLQSLESISLEENDQTLLS